MSLLFLSDSFFLYIETHGNSRFMWAAMLIPYRGERGVSETKFPIVCKNTSGGLILPQSSIPTQSTISRKSESHNPCRSAETHPVRETGSQGRKRSAQTGQTLQKVSTTSTLCSFKTRDHVSLIFLPLALCISFCTYLISMDIFLLNKYVTPG